MDETTPYPGASAKPLDLLKLADAYRGAADVIAASARKGDPVSRAPYRLSAIHAIELYLNALLIHLGHEPAEIRGFRHDLATRAALAEAGGLTLRKRTASHLRAMAESREYLVARYGPEMKVPLSPLNRLAATLAEVALKVSAVVRNADEWSRQTDTTSVPASSSSSRLRRRSISHTHQIEIS